MSEEVSAVESAVVAALGDDVRCHVETFPSGAVSISLHIGDHFASLHGVRDEWGVSVDPARETGFLGHDEVHTSLDDALAAVRRRLAEAG